MRIVGRVRWMGLVGVLLATSCGSSGEDEGSSSGPSGDGSIQDHSSGVGGASHDAGTGDRSNGSGGAGGAHGDASHAGGSTGSAGAGGDQDGAAGAHDGASGAAGSGGGAAGSGGGAAGSGGGAAGSGGGAAGSGDGAAGAGASAAGDGAAGTDGGGGASDSDAGNDGAAAAAGGSADGGVDGSIPCLSDQNCTDSIFCNGAEHCVSGFCATGAPPSCDDGLACTQDFCSSSSDKCEHVPDDAVCQDAWYCNGGEKCAPSDSSHDAKGCIPGAPIVCDDDLACTDDKCSDTSKGCEFTPVDSRCSDGKFCNGQEICVVGTGCQSGTSPTCDDGIGCTTNGCDDTAGCIYTPQNGLCDDGLFCNGAEVCTLAGCVAGTPVTCTPDSTACTVEACSEQTKGCASTPDNSLCSGGNPFCVAGLGCVAKACPNGNSDCNDGLFCNGIETCVSGACQPGPAPDCSDAYACTVDFCSESSLALDHCEHTPNQTYCDDGRPCNGIETCAPAQANLAGGCKSGAPIVCDDGIACTHDRCDDSLADCVFTPDNTTCDDNVFCNGAEACDLVLGCVLGDPVVCPDDGIGCTVESCDQTTDKCVSSADDSRCDTNYACKIPGGCTFTCQVRACGNHVYQCGDCLDNDVDGRVDSADPDCTGPCKNTEVGLWGGISGQNNAPCKMDCFWDQDTGSGNDQCYWDHRCDPNEVSPNYYPEAYCDYAGSSYKVQGNQTCANLYASQSATCAGPPNPDAGVAGGICSRFTPNGCDCFGCCQIPGAPTTVYLNSQDAQGTYTCTLADAANPTKCHPCQQVPSCFNSCETCELCLGKVSLPPQCGGTQTCPSGGQLCGLPGQQSCPSGYYCVTGCCVQLEGL